MNRFTCLLRTWPSQVGIVTMMNLKIPASDNLLRRKQMGKAGR